MKSKTTRSFSGEAKYNKFDIAIGQLETAIALFLTDGADMFSAITLANAAGEILHSFVLRAGKKPMVDDVVKIDEERSGGPTKGRQEIIKHINKILFANELKHFDLKGSELVEFDPEVCAVAYIVKAMSDYETLTGGRTARHNLMLHWIHQNMGQVPGTN